MLNNFNDFAIILTWPDATIRGDEKWMMFFKKIGFVKNLNFKVGHTGIIIINSADGVMHFYDFGRYIAPRGYGRARSEHSDPLLKINFKAQIKDNKLVNLEEIIEHIEAMKEPMYGQGRLFFSLVSDINFFKAKDYGDECVTQGTYPYGAVAKNNNNCSRFITRMLIKSSIKYHHLHPINFPETIKSSPISNLTNTSSNRKILSYTPEEGLKSFKMNRFQSLLFLIKQLSDNVSKTRSKTLPKDEIIGAMAATYRPITVRAEAKYLGGVGDGAWYDIQVQNKQLIIKRFTTQGRLEYTVLGEANNKLDLNKKFEITYDSNLLFTHVIQENKKIRINHQDKMITESAKLKEKREYNLT